MTPALTTITNRINKHHQHKVALYVQRNRILRERKAVETALAANNRREDEAFMAEIGRVKAKQRKLYEEQIRLESGLTKGEMLMMVDRASAAAKALGREEGRRRELGRRIRRIERKWRKKAGAIMDTCRVQAKDVVGICWDLGISGAKKRHGNNPTMHCRRPRDTAKVSPLTAVGSDASECPAVPNVKLEFVKKEDKEMSKESPWG
ncbi:hypothetical protein EMCG_01911 [[Emmonsia] crescens]|uniref:Uncharacterized protein n=1 Tax=[Emmonsia] crescens TaxID=73230 RepID=A0A0G2HZN8_9EURO|nr:hypothetical protein EMCG_01911 [Emmonsia crescens UAMH 3008]